MWYHEVIGGKRCPIVDTWWQTETGGIMITPARRDADQAGHRHAAVLRHPTRSRRRPGKAVSREIRRQTRHPQTLAQACCAALWGDPKRFKETVLERGQGSYFTGDGCRQDKDGYFWIVGRIDDVLNVAGHRIGTAEVESALVSHPKVAEAAVVGRPDELKGQALVAFVTLKTASSQPELREELRQHVGKEIGPVAKPDDIRFAEALPKTRSGRSCAACSSRSPPARRSRATPRRWRI
jgi:acetyl-CoA synthetase